MMMTRARLDGVLLVLLGSAVFLFLGISLERHSPASMVDFKDFYYGARCLLQHSDPYRESDLQRVYQAEQGDHPSTPNEFRQVVTLFINPPTVFLLTTPFALLPWGPAHVLWMILSGASFLLAAWLMWTLAAREAPVISGVLICLFLCGSELLLEVGNAAGIAVSLCVIAVWCFLKERCVPAGILCLALSLTLKPHVAGLVWLYFLLAYGRLRKRALQTLAVTAVLSLPVILWVWHIAPHWNAELHANLQPFSVHGGLGDPGPAGVDPRLHGATLINMQTAFSIFRDDRRFYNPATYLLCAPLLLVWAIATLRRRFSQQSACLALAAIAAISMLPLFHRVHDTRLLLLIFPAFAMLWARGGPTAWFALLFTSAGVVFTDNNLLQLLAIYSNHLRESTPGLPGLLLTIVLARPAPLVLLTMGIFYLWIYVRHSSPVDATAAQNPTTISAADTALVSP